MSVTARRAASGDGGFSGLCADVSVVSRWRWHAWQPEVVTQRRPLVLTPKQPARLKLRHDQVDEVDQRAREVRGKDVETVRGFLDEPFLQRVGDALGGPAEDPVAAGGRGQVVEIAQGHVFAPRRLVEHV